MSPDAKRVEGLGGPKGKYWGKRRSGSAEDLDVDCRVSVSL